MIKYNTFLLFYVHFASNCSIVTIFITVFVFMLLIYSWYHNMVTLRPLSFHFLGNRCKFIKNISLNLNLTPHINLTDILARFLSVPCSISHVVYEKKYVTNIQREWFSPRLKGEVVNHGISTNFEDQKGFSK